jgi:hypothetical protein
LFVGETLGRIRRQAWEAVRGGNFGVGACASTAEGEIIHASRNRVNEQDAALRWLGEGPVLDVAYALKDGGELDALTAMEVDQALAALWSRLQVLRQTAVKPSA